MIFTDNETLILFKLFEVSSIYVKEKFEDNKGVIRSRQSENARQWQKKKEEEEMDTQ